MAAVDYTDKRVLLVESSGNMRAAIFYMLRSLGVANIRASSVNDRVLSEIQTGDYDIVLLGHNVSDTVAGIQLLEEARYLGYMKPTASWVFMTSDASQETVLHAIDSRPDILITKPFTVDELKQRLDGLVRKRMLFHDIDRALQSGDDEAALRIALTSFSPGHPYFHDAQLIACKLLVKLERYPQLLQLAENLYWKTHDKEAGLYWAEGLLNTGDIDGCVTFLRDLIAKNPLYMAAYDLLTLAHEMLGELDEARDIVQVAASKAPMGIPRQMELGRLATQTSQLEVAQGAYKRSISLGHKSCYKSPEPYLRLANVHRLEAAGAEDNRRLDLEKRFEETLSQASVQFRDKPELAVKTALLRGEMAKTLGQEDEASACFQEAEQLNSMLEEPLGLEQEMAALNGKSAVKPKPKVVKKSAASSGRDPDMSSKVNRQGIKHYANGRLSQALRHFGLALEYDPTNGRALCNLAQMYLELARDDTSKRDARLIMFDRNIYLAGKLPLSAEAAKKKEMLQALRTGDMDAMPEGQLGLLLK